jgi:hypothetical protein
LKDFHPLVKTIFVPTNCTSVFQPANVILQRPFKHAFRNEFDDWSMDQIQQQLENATPTEGIKLESKLSVLKPLLCSWLYKAWLHIHKKKMVQIGWEKCGLLQAFQPKFQATALNENMTSPLFKGNDVQAEETMNKEDMANDIELETTIKTVMEDSLKRLANIQDLQASGARVSTMKVVARKRHFQSAMQ